MASTDSGRGTKRSIDEVESDEDAFERYGKLLWDYMIYHTSRTVIGLVAFISGDKNGFFVIGSDPDGTRWKSSEPIWPNYADIWLATRQHPGETVETIDSRPTREELSNRMAIFVRKARDQQRKYRLSRSKFNHSCPANSGAIIVSGPTNKSHHAAKSQASLPMASEHGFDFFDGLAHAARQRSIQETNGLTAHIKYLSTMLEDTRAALSDEKQSHRQDVEDTRKEVAKLTEEAEKKIQGLSAALDEEKKSSKDHAETAHAKINNLLAQLEELKKAHEKDMQVAESEIQQLRVDIDANKNAASSKLKKEKEARRKAAEESSAVVQKLLAKHRKEQQDLSLAHGWEKKSLLKASKESTAKVRSFEAKVQDLSSKIEKERQNRHEAINNAVEEAQRRMAKHHNEVMEEIATKHNEDKRSLKKKAEDSESDLLRLKDYYQKQSQELEKEKSDRRQEEADHKMEMECLESENKTLKKNKEAHAQLRDEVAKLEQTKSTLQTTVDRFMAVANDCRP